MHARACPALLRSRIFGRCSIMKDPRGHLHSAHPGKQSSRHWAGSGQKGALLVVRQRLQGSARSHHGGASRGTRGTGKVLGELRHSHHACPAPARGLPGRPQERTAGPKTSHPVPEKEEREGFHQ